MKLWLPCGLAVVIVGLSFYFSPTVSALREYRSQENFANEFLTSAKAEFRRKFVSEIDSRPKALRENLEQSYSDVLEAERGLIDQSIDRTENFATKSDLKKWGFKAWIDNAMGGPNLFVTFSHPNFHLYHIAFDGRN